MIKRKNAKLIYHDGINPVFLAVEDEDGKVTLWNAGGLTFASRHATIDTAYNEACRIIGHERFTNFYKEQQLESA